MTLPVAPYPWQSLKWFGTVVQKLSLGCAVFGDHLHGSILKSHVSESPWCSENIRMHHSSVFMVVGDLECLTANYPGHTQVFGGREPWSQLSIWGMSLIYTEECLLLGGQRQPEYNPYPRLKFSSIPLAALSSHVFFSFMKTLIQVAFQYWLGSILSLSLRQVISLHLASVSSLVKWIAWRCLQC